jgi:predicted AAA+ superfamily ATPase
MIIRPNYLNKLIAFQDQDLIKVVTGVRRSGKSTLLDMMRAHLKQQGIPESQLLTFRMESMEFSVIADRKDLYKLVRQRVGDRGRSYLFFDELQEVKDWERAINSLRVDVDCDIYITGSNAFLLSSEIAT